MMCTVSRKTMARVRLPFNFTIRVWVIISVLIMMLSQDIQRFSCDTLRSLSLVQIALLCCCTANVYRLPFRSTVLLLIPGMVRGVRGCRCEVWCVPDTRFQPHIVYNPMHVVYSPMHTVYSHIVYSHIVYSHIVYSHIEYSITLFPTHALLQVTAMFFMLMPDVGVCSRLVHFIHHPQPTDQHAACLTVHSHATMLSDMLWATVTPAWQAHVHDHRRTSYKRCVTFGVSIAWLFALPSTMLALCMELKGRAAYARRHSQHGLRALDVAGMYVMAARWVSMMAAVAAYSLFAVTVLL